MHAVSTFPVVWKSKTLLCVCVLPRSLRPSSRGTARRPRDGPAGRCARLIRGTQHGKPLGSSQLCFKNVPHQPTTFHTTPHKRARAFMMMRNAAAVQGAPSHLTAKLPGQGRRQPAIYGAHRRQAAAQPPSDERAARLAASHALAARPPKTLAARCSETARLLPPRPRLLHQCCSRRYTTGSCSEPLPPPPLREGASSCRPLMRPAARWRRSGSRRRPAGPRPGRACGCTHTQGTGALDEWHHAASRPFRTCGRRTTFLDLVQ